jgi:hypothetical protein
MRISQFRTTWATKQDLASKKKNHEFMLNLIILFLNPEYTITWEYLKNNNAQGLSQSILQDP